MDIAEFLCEFAKHLVDNIPAGFHASSEKDNYNAAKEDESKIKEMMEDFAAEKKADFSCTVHSVESHFDVPEDCKQGDLHCVLDGQKFYIDLKVGNSKSTVGAINASSVLYFGEKDADPHFYLLVSSNFQTAWIVDAYEVRKAVEFSGKLFFYETRSERGALINPKLDFRILKRFGRLDFACMHDYLPTQFIYNDRSIGYCGLICKAERSKKRVIVDELTESLKDRVRESVLRSYV